ncbi:MAG: DUF1697 domain-containing protein [Flavobacteriales bacterium]|jgi:uncharacterized protein (DUF1697 family)|nr:DUF1697 domain-containing protein [Flavobacteriales bacterium]
MKRLVAILRGINVGGKRKILMKDLSSLLEKEGFINVKTYIQSGNIGFDSSENSSQSVTKIENLIKLNFGFEVPVVVLEQNQIQEIIDKMPYDESENIHITFLKEPPAKENIDSIPVNDYLPEAFKITPYAVYLKCVDKYHQSKLSNNFFEKKLGVTATTRNWKTVNKLVEL